MPAPRPSLSRRAALGRLGAATAALALPTPALAAPRRPAPLGDDEVERLLRLASVPSVSWALVDGDRITTRSVGVRRAGEPARATPDTVYAAASLTKAVVAYLLLGLVREGALSLDRPVREYLPLPNADDPRGAALTARHLLSHSGGWRNWRNGPGDQLVSAFEPGARWSYSGEGFFFLQRVAEKLTGRSIGALARERVFDPLGMRRSALALPAELEPHLAAGHNGRGDPVTPFGRPTLLELRRAMAERGAPPDAATAEDAERAIRAAEPALPVLPNFLVPNAAASLVTTPDDFARFARHLATARRAGGAPAAIVELMATPQVRCNEAVRWGLGMGIEDVAGRARLWQWGDNPGYKNYVSLDPQRGSAVVVFTNGDRGARVYERVIRALTGDDHPGFLWS